jgi:cysteinyl-tRNA synthetase
MSRGLLGMPMDIHGGGPDLKFPHHENEIAQSEGAFGGTLARTWMHCGPMMVDADKKSKSLGNFRTIRATLALDEPADDVADYTANPREAEMLRFFIVRNHYRSIQNYAPDNLLDAQHALDRLYQTLLNVPPVPTSIDWAHPAAAAFKAAMDDDFNTSGAVAVLFDLAGQANREGAGELSGLMRSLGGVLGLLQHDPERYLKSPTRYLGGAPSAEVLSAEQIDEQVAERGAAKARRDFAHADRIRASLRELGIELEDKAGGVTQWRRV